MVHNVNKDHISVPEFPKMVIVGVSYKCNSECPHCPFYHSSLKQESPEFIDIFLFKNIVDQIVEQGNEDVILRITGGGEPMLHPNIIELLRYAKDNKVKLGLITNGSSFTEKQIVEIVDMGVDMVEFSVDAADEKTYKIVRNNLDFNKLVSTVKEFVEYRNNTKAPVKIIASIINQKGVDIDQAVKFWEDIVDFVQKRKFLPWRKHNPEDSADKTTYLDRAKDPCPQPFTRVNLNSLGDVSFCFHDVKKEDRRIMGNIKRDRIIDLWHGDLVNKYRQMHLDGSAINDDLCKNCTEWDYKSWTHNYWKIRSNLGI